MTRPERQASDPVAALVVDAATLRRRLEAAAIMLRAQRVTLVIPTAAGLEEIAGGGGPKSGPTHEIAAAVGPALLVASRAAPTDDFGATDGRLLKALAASLRDTLSYSEDETAPASRFRRPGRSAPADTGTRRRTG